MRVMMTDRCLFDSERHPIRFSESLVKVFKDAGLVVILSEDADQTRRDLITNRIYGDIDVYQIDGDRSLQDNIASLRAEFRIDVIIDSDPALITWAYAQGYKCLLAVEPKFMDPRFRPDGKGLVPWTQLVDEIENQTKMLADKRFTWEKSGFNEWE